MGAGRPGRWRPGRRRRRAAGGRPQAGINTRLEAGPPGASKHPVSFAGFNKGMISRQEILRLRQFFGQISIDDVVEVVYGKGLLLGAVAGLFELQ